MVDLTAREVTYIHLLLERHQRDLGQWAGDGKLPPVEHRAGHDRPARSAAGLLALLPGIEINPHAYGDYARRNLSATEAAILRHEMLRAGPPDGLLTLPLRPV